MFLTKAVGKTKTHFMLNTFFPENRNFQEIIWNNLVKADTPQVTMPDNLG